MPSDRCSHKDSRVFDHTIACLSCGTTRNIALEKEIVPSNIPQVPDWAPYSYQSLDQDRNEIRLLELVSTQPAPFPSSILRPRTERPLHCRLIKCRLEKAPPYIAISYTWATEDGDISRSQPLLTWPDYRQEEKRVIWITENCANALRQQLHYGGSTKMIWIDSVCIDQDRISERNHQVGLMDRIYKGATRVDICITSSEPLIDGVLQLLNNHATLDRLDDSNLPQDIAHAVEQLRAFFGLRYFSRVWVRTLLKR
jgi:hypothetical protein